MLNIKNNRCGQPSCFFSDIVITKANMPCVDCSSTSYSLVLKPLSQVNMLYRNIAVEEYLGTFLEPLWVLCCHEPDCPML